MADQEKQSWIKQVGAFFIEERSLGGYSLYEVVSYMQEDRRPGDKKYPMCLFRHMDAAIEWAKNKERERRSVGQLETEEIAEVLVERVRLGLMEDMDTARHLH